MLPLNTNSGGTQEAFYRNATYNKLGHPACPAAGLHLFIRLFGGSGADALCAIVVSSMPSQFF